MTTENLENSELTPEQAKVFDEQTKAFKEKYLNEKKTVSNKQNRYKVVEAHYSKKLNELIHEHFQKITSDTDQEQLEAILQEGNKKWLAICARARQTDSKIITLNINAFTDFLKEAMTNGTK